jgi:membrane-associated protein
MPLVVHAASISDQISGWYDQVGPWLFYGIVWALVFAGTGLFIGAFVPFITGDSLVFAAGLVAATHPQDESIWIMAIGVGIAAFLGDQVGYEAWGWWAVVIARFMPWARVFIPAIAGIAKMNYYKFFSANIVGAIAWGVGLTVTGYFAASIPAVKNASYAIAGFFIVASLIAGIRVWLKNRKTA